MVHIIFIYFLVNEWCEFVNINTISNSGSFLKSKGSLHLKPSSHSTMFLLLQNPKYLALLLKNGIVSCTESNKSIWSPHNGLKLSYILQPRKPITSSSGLHGNSGSYAQRKKTPKKQGHTKSYWYCAQCTKNVQSIE